MIRKCLNHTSKTNPRHREEESQNTSSRKQPVTHYALMDSSFYFDRGITGQKKFQNTIALLSRFCRSNMYKSFAREDEAVYMYIDIVIWFTILLIRRSGSEFRLYFEILMSIQHRTLFYSSH